MTGEHGGRTRQMAPADGPGSHEYRPEGYGPPEYTGDDPRELRAQVERTRAQLGDTVEELATRADVRAIARRRVAGARERAAHVRSRARDRVTRAGMVPLAVTGTVVTLGAAAGALVHRHRHGGGR